MTDGVHWRARRGAGGGRGEGEGQASVAPFHYCWKLHAVFGAGIRPV